MNMYIVKRPFRNLGKVLTPGSVITDTTSIKLFRSRVAEGKIVRVDERNYDSTSAYFKAKYGVDIPPLKGTEKAEVIEAETDAGSNEMVAKVVASVVSTK